jgi:predicted RNase H-like nuclease (RuvC/YqgF family)
VRVTRQFRVFLGLSAAAVLASLGWGWIRWRGAAPERAAWASVQRDMAVESARIDSLRWEIAHMETELNADKRAIASAAERLAHIRREAVNGALPEAEYRRYQREVERHNEAVASHNIELAALQRTYAEYSASVDAYNALADSANELQRRAVQEGVQLAEPR